MTGITHHVYHLVSYDISACLIVCHFWLAPGMPICRMVVLHGGLPLGFRRHDRKHLKTHIAIRSKIIVVKAKQKKAHCAAFG